MRATPQDALSGFDAPVRDATRVFRKTLDAMARPGRIMTLDQKHDVPCGLSQGATAVLLALADMETAIWLAPDVDGAGCREFLAFHTGSRIVASPRQAVFAIATDRTDPDFRKALATGTAENPDLSATLILILPALDNGAPVTLSGPGIQNTTVFSPQGVDPEFWQWFSETSALFPRGVDVFLTSGNQLAALPRSVKVEV